MMKHKNYDDYIIFYVILKLMVIIGFSSCIPKKYMAKYEEKFFEWKW